MKTTRRGFMQMLGLGASTLAISPRLGATRARNRILDGEWHRIDMVRLRSRFWMTTKWHLDGEPANFNWREHATVRAMFTIDPEAKNDELMVTTELRVSDPSIFNDFLHGKGEVFSYVFPEKVSVKIPYREPPAAALLYAESSKIKRMPKHV